MSKFQRRLKGYNTHYSYNYAHIATSYRMLYPRSGWDRPAKEGEIRQPHRTILLVEGKRYGTVPECGCYLMFDSYTASSSYANPDPRHNKFGEKGTFHVLFCDGHVDPITVPRAQDAYTTSYLGSYNTPGKLGQWKRY